MVVKNRSLHGSKQRHDLVAVVIIGLYCLLHFMLRVLISPSMELDESEQFLQVTAPYISPQPLLYTFIVKAVSLLSGQIFISIIVVKYATLLAFYLFFYWLARTYWSARESLVITASLTLFPTYSYEFVRDLSHSILASVFAIVAALAYSKRLSSPRAAVSFYLVAALCLGTFSKYVFVFFLLALVFSDSIVKERWKAMSSGRRLLCISLLSLSAISFIILLDSDALPFLRKILNIAHQGDLAFGEPLRVSNLLFKAFMEVLIFGAVFLLFFRRHVSMRYGQDFPAVRFFRSLAAMATLIPLATILLLRLGQFRARWLAPVMFSIPLALFSLVDLKKNRRLTNLFGYFCLVIAISIFLIRALIGLTPDLIGKKERVHIPFESVSLVLTHRVASLGAGDVGNMVMISDRQYLVANMMRWLHTNKYVLVDDKHILDPNKLSAIRRDGGIIVWNASLQGEAIPGYFLDIFPALIPLEPIRAPYVRSGEMFSMGVAIVPKG